MNKLLAGASILCFMLVLLGINRGFDISDEGLYVLLADPDQENVSGIFNYDLFFKLLYKITGYSFTLVELRILRLLSYLAGAWALAGFWKNISDEPIIRWDIFWISCLGIFMGYAFLPPSLSYNSLTVVIICFWLKFLSNQTLTLKTIFALGVLLAALVYIKITVAILFFPLTVFVLILRKKTFGIKIIFLLAPVILSELTFISLFQENAWTRLLEGIPLNSVRSGYHLGLMLKSVAVGFFWISILGLLFFGLGYFRKNKSLIYHVLQIVTAFGVFVIGYFTHITEEWNHMFLLLAAGIFGFQLGCGGLKLEKLNPWILILMILPFLLHLGSNVYWLRIGIHYAVFWILGLLLISKRQPQDMQWAISIIAVFLVFNGIWWHPFSHEKPLWEKKIEWKMGEREVLLLDPELVYLASQLREFDDRYFQNQLLVAYRIPGLVWLTGSTIPFSPIIWEKSQLKNFFEGKPEIMVFNKIDDLPQNWIFNHKKELGVFRSDTLQLLWD